MTRDQRPSAVTSAAALALAWLGYLVQLRLNWDPAGYYSFGWCVGPIAAALAWTRVQDAGASRVIATGPRWTLFAAAALVLAAVPFRVAMELNPFWRLPLWGAGVCLVGATWLGVWRFAGWRNARTQAFPCASLLLMVPWPAVFERRLIDTLTGLITTTNVELLQLAGLPAEAQGNVITMGAATVGVDDACSGIRSLQLLLALALFVGAFWRLAWHRRALLPVIAVLVAFIGNVARSIALSLAMFQGGESVYSAWHDPAGYLSMTASAATLLGLAWWWSRQPVAATASFVGAAPMPATAAAPRAWIATAVFAVCCLAPEATTRAWFSSAPASATPRGFVVRWPETGDVRAETLPMDERVREILGFDYGDHVVLREGGAVRADAWYYGFTARSGSKSLSAYVHQPTVCMTANGAQLLATNAPQPVDLGPFELVFEHYTFRLAARGGGQLSQVYWCVWDDLAGATRAADGFRSANLHALLARTRSLERQVLLISVPEADPALARRRLMDLVRAAVTPIIDGEELTFR